MMVRNKEIKDYINVSMAVGIEWGDTKNENWLKPEELSIVGGK